MNAEHPSVRPQRIPPRWFIRAVWRGHRLLVRLSDGRLGLIPPTPGGRFGMLRLRTVGRRSGQERAVILGYLVDGPELFTLAMNGWGEATPAWQLNLQAQPDAEVDLADGTRPVRATIATGEQRERMLDALRACTGYGNDLDALIARRGDTDVVVFSPREALGAAAAVEENAAR